MSPERNEGCVWVVARKKRLQRRAGIASYLVHVVSAGCGSSPSLIFGRKTGMWVAAEESPLLLMLCSPLLCRRIVWWQPCGVDLK